MRTLAILVLTLFTLVLSQNSFNSTTISNTETQTAKETTPTPRITNETTTVPATGEKTTTTPAASSQSPSPPTVTSESRSPTNVTQLNKMSSSSPSKTIASANKKSHSRILIATILLVLLLVLVLAGCIHGLWTRRSTQDDSTPRLLLTMRDTLRAGINNLGDRIGVVLWPGSKREGEDEDEEEEVEGKQGDVEEGGQESDNGDNSEGKDRRGEQSDSSDDYSSLEGKDLREMALSRQEANKQSGDKEEIEGSIPSDRQHNPAQGQENGKKEGGLEEIALINSPTEEDENAGLCDETIF